MKAEDLMTRNVKACAKDASLAAAAQLMWENDCGCVPVVDAEERLVGMITDRDICMAAHFKGRPIQTIAVKEVMSRDVVACMPSATIKEAEAAMQRAQVRRLPVVSAPGRLLGILSLTDIARQAEREKTSRAPEVGLNDVALTLSAVCQQRYPQAAAASAE